MTRSFTVLVNPMAGGGAAPGAAVPVSSLLRRAGARVEVVYSPGPLALARLVDEAMARDDVVVCVGGDGMLSATVGRVARGGGTLGLVPAGRGNDFARMLALPSTPDAVAQTLLHGEVRELDLIEVGGRVVAGSVYAGVDARAAEMVDRSRWVPRPAQYPVAAVRALATYRPAQVEVEVDGARSSYRAALVVVANSGYYGAGMHIAPAASLTDGLLDVVVVPGASRRALLRALPSVYDGSHVERDDVTVLRGARVRLSAPQPLECGADGEPMPALGPEPLEVAVRPRALRVLAG